MGSGGSRALWSPGMTGVAAPLVLGEQRGFGEVVRLGLDWHVRAVCLLCTPERRLCCRPHPKRFGCYMVKPHGQLVRVSFTHCCASTPRLSTWWSSTALQGAHGSREISSWEGLPAWMLSAVIPSAHSYPAVPLA